MAGLQGLWKTRFVMISGVSAGVGKTTLARALAGRRSGSGLPVDLFTEEQLFSREEFAEIGTAFRDRTYPSSEMMLEGYRRILAGLESDHEAIIFDWSCLGMISDLPWAEGRQDVLEAHASEVARLTASMGPALIYLEAEPEVAVQRAVAQRGDRWARRYARLAAEGRVAPTRDFLTVIADGIRSDATRHMENQAYRSAGWSVVEIDARMEADAVLDAAWRALT